MSRKDLDPQFVEWYYGAGNGKRMTENKSEVEKIEIAYLEGLRLGTAMSRTLLDGQHEFLLRVVGKKIGAKLH